MNIFTEEFIKIEKSKKNKKEQFKMLLDKLLEQEATYEIIKLTITILMKFKLYNDGYNILQKNKEFFSIKEYKKYEEQFKDHIKIDNINPLTKLKEKELYEYLNGVLDKSPCNNTVQKTTTWLLNNYNRKSAVIEILDFLETQGAFCDCEVFDFLDDRNLNDL